MSMWGNTTDSISALPYHDAILSMFSASGLDARFQIIRKNHAVLTSHATLDALEEDIERSWNQGDRTMADFLWQMQKLLQRVRENGIDAAIEAYSQPIDYVHDITVSLERSATPLQTWTGVYALLTALSTGDEFAVYHVLAEYMDQFRQPVALSLVYHQSRIPTEIGRIGSANFGYAAQLIEAIARDRDIQETVSNWRPSKEETLQQLSEPRRAIAEFVLTSNWYEAQRCVQDNYDILLSNSALDALRSATRDAWQSNRNIGRHFWKHLRLLEQARMHGIDVAFDRLIWGPDAERFWQSEREIGIMEAANVPLGDLRGLELLLTALKSGDTTTLQKWIELYWNDIQHPWFANSLRYMAEIAEIEGVSSRELWETLANWLDSLRGTQEQEPAEQKWWPDIPNVDGLAIL